MRSGIRLTVALWAAVALGSIGSVASAESSRNPKADIQRGNASCGADLSANPVDGFANFHRRGDTVSVQFHLKHGKPKHTYRIQLWGGACSFIGPVIPTQSNPFGLEVSTNKRGVANANLSVTVPHAQTRFFATAWDGPGNTCNNAANTCSDTPAVTLVP